jgi:hypothetical protein
MVLFSVVPFHCVGDELEVLQVLVLVLKHAIGNTLVACPTGSPERPMAEAEYFWLSAGLKVGPL